MSLASDNIKWARARGWRAEKTNGQHIRFRHPLANETVVTGSSPGHSGVKNFQAQIKKIERQSNIPEPDVTRGGKRIESFEMGRDEQQRPIAVAKCSECGYRGVWQGRQPGAQHSDNSLTLKRFRNLGWICSLKRADDICPSCALKVSEEKPEESNRELALVQPIKLQSTPDDERRMQQGLSSFDVTIKLPEPVAEMIDKNTRSGLYGTDRASTISIMFLEYLRKLKAVANKPKT